MHFIPRTNMTEISILDIPDVALEKIFTYLTYEEIANNRLVCRQFNNICGGLLTKGFIQLEKKHAHIYKIVKSLLPRRPSERRSNAIVSRYCEILIGMETRIRMLNVTYMRYIDQHLICFVPGKVLDEIKKLLRLIENRFNPPNNNNQLLEELRDLSSMAMEHFDEYILPLLEKKEKVTLYKNAIDSDAKTMEYSKTLKQLRKLHKRNRFLETQVSYLTSKSRRQSQKWNRQNFRIKKQASIIREQNAKLKVQASRLENHEIVISEMQKKIEEMQNNFLEIKTKWKLDTVQKKANIMHTSELPSRDIGTVAHSDTLMQHMKRIMQQETVRQKYATNKTAINKSQFSGLQRDEKRKKHTCTVDMENLRRRYPTARMSFLNCKNNLKNRTEILLNRNQSSNEPIQSASDYEEKSKLPSNIVHKTIIKQRASRIFPLSYLDLDRKRKSHTCSEIPPKLSKSDNSHLNANPNNMFLSEQKHTKDKRIDNLLSNIISIIETRPPKRKRINIDDA